MHVYPRPQASKTFRFCPRVFKMESFSCESMVRGYHVYKDIWDAVEEQILDCQ